MPREPIEIDAPQLTLREHVEPTKPNVYDPIVKQLIDAGPGKDGAVIVPAVTLKKHKRELQKAASNANRTARVIEENAQGDSSIELVFQLREKVTRDRKKKTDEPTGDEPVIEKADDAPAAA